MFRFVREVFTENVGLKIIALLLALISWFYIVKELNSGTEEDVMLLQKIMPAQEMAAKKLTIRPIFIGKTRNGFGMVRDKVYTMPEYCIVVGVRDILEKIKYAYTTPIDLNGVYKTFSSSVPLSPIAPGVYMEETLVQVTVPIERSGD